MIELPATIRNEQGIHCRPSAVIIKAVKNYDGEIRVISEEGECDSDHQEFEQFAGF